MHEVIVIATIDMVQAIVAGIIASDCLC